MTRAERIQRLGNDIESPPRCDPACKGWAIFNAGDRFVGGEVQACDSCVRLARAAGLTARVPDDTAAAEQARAAGHEVREHDGEVFEVVVDGVRYQENAEDRYDLDKAEWPKFIVGAQLRYRGPSDDNPPTGLRPGDLVTVAERNGSMLGSGDGIAVVGPRGGVDMVWWYEVDVVNTPEAAPVDGA